MKKFTTTMLSCLLMLPAMAFTPGSVCYPGLADVETEIPATEAVKNLPPTRAEEGIITEAPEGKTVQYELASYAFANNYGRVSYEYTFANERQAVFTDDAMYLLNPLTGLLSNTYLKASKIDDSTYQATLPFPIYSEVDGNGVVYNYDLTMMDVIHLEGGGVTYESNDDTSVTFRVEDGKIYLDLGYVNTPDPDTNYPSFPDKILGMSYQGQWAGNGEAQQVWTPYDTTLATPPADLATEKWAMTYDGNAAFVNVGFDGDTVWIGGMYMYMPELWVYGKVIGDKVRIESGQYALTQYGQYYCINNCTSENYTNTLIDYYDYDYDSDAKSIRANNPTVGLILCGGRNPSYNYSFLWLDPTFLLQPADIDQKPMNPYAIEEWGYDTVNLDFQLPFLNKDGYLLDTGKMYYQVRYDGDVETFFEEDYPYDGIIEEMTNIPYTWSSTTFYSYGTMHTLKVQPLWLNTVGFQLFNEAPDGSVYSSDIVTYDLNTGEVTTGIHVVKETRPVKEISYYTLDGKIIDNPSEGIFIQKKVFDDGTSQVRKIVRRN